MECDEAGVAQWTLMAGSHGHRRKQWARIEHRFKVPELIERGIVTETPSMSSVILVDGKNWQIEQIIEPNPEYPESVQRVHCFQINADNEPVLRISEFWEPLTENLKLLFDHVIGIEWHEPKHSIIVYGEIYGGGVQDMTYGLSGRSFRAFDISINNQYLDYHVKTKLFSTFEIESVPYLYTGPFTKQVVEQFTNGATTVCSKEKAGKFAGREGIVITPTTEVHYCSSLNGRRILKSISADYLARKGGTEFH